MSLKILCPTRWTARTAAIDAILKDYGVLLEVLEEIHETTTDEYGTKEFGLLQLLEKFNILFGLKLSYLLFSAAEQVSLALQKNNIAIQDALSAVDAAKAHFNRIRSDKEFSQFYEKTLTFAEEKGIEQPVLPRNRRRPQRYDNGCESHVFPSVKEYYRQMYYEACDLISGELQRRFETKHSISDIN